MLGILAVGNELRGDDGVGLFAGRLLLDKGFPVVLGHETPENVLGELQGFNRVLVLDAAQFEGKEPFVIAPPGGGGYSHRAGLQKLGEFLGVEMVVLGIKAYKRALGDGVSEAAMENAREAVKVVEVCMAVPGEVVDADRKVVKFGEEEKKVKFAVPGLKKGDFVLVHAGVVVEKLSREDYGKTREAICSLLGE